MGTRDVGAFANDAAADFLIEAAENPTRAVGKALRAAATAKADSYLQVDEGQAAHAAAEIVAMAFGRMDSSNESDAAGEVAAKVKPTEALRGLALEALERLAGPASEVASLWAQGKAAAAFTATIDSLRARLVDAKSGPRKVPRPKAGDVLEVAHEGELFVVQLVAPREMVVFRGARGEEGPLAVVGARDGVRVPYDAAELARVGRVVGRAPIRPAFKGKKIYAHEVGSVEGYALVNAAFKDWRRVKYEEARAYDTHERYRAMDWARFARGESPRRPRSPDEREAAIRQQSKRAWEKRRSVTGPGPFDDPESLAALLNVDSTLIAANLRKAASDGAGGGDNEWQIRWSYGQAGLAALWIGRWPKDNIPAILHDRASAPNVDLAACAAGARAIVERVAGRESELRMMWEDAPDGGAAFHAALAALRSALGG